MLVWKHAMIQVAFKITTNGVISTFSQKRASFTRTSTSHAPKYIIIVKGISTRKVLQVTTTNNMLSAWPCDVIQLPLLFWTQGKVSERSGWKWNAQKNVENVLTKARCQQMRFWENSCVLEYDNWHAYVNQLLENCYMYFDTNFWRIFQLRGEVLEKSKHIIE